MPVQFSFILENKLRYKIQENSNLIFAAGVIRNLNDDLWLPLRIEVIHETCKDEHTQKSEKTIKKFTQT